MTSEGEKDVEKQEKIEAKDARLPGDDDALQSTRKAGELESERLQKLRVEREKLGHLSIFSLGSGSVLEIVDSTSDAARKVFGFDVSESKEPGPVADVQRPHASQAKVVSDEYARVCKITYPSGFSVDVTYGAPGRYAEAQEIRLSNGTTLKKMSDGSWHQIADSSGTVLGGYATVEISEEGALNFQGEDHGLTWMPVGTTLLTDRYGRLAKVTYPSGFFAEVTYSGAGEDARADAVKLSDDTTLKRQPDGTWSKTADRSGVVIEQYQKVAVAEDGTLKFETEHSTLCWHPEGCAITTDQYGRLSKVTYVSGLSAQVTYEKQGQGARPAKIKLSNDTVLDRNPDGSWSQKVSTTGEVITQYKSLDVGGDGSIHMEAEGLRVAWRPDGTTVATDLSTGQMTCLHADGTRERLAASAPQPPAKGS
jgi:hypothetical protein